MYPVYAVDCNTGSMFAANALQQDVITQIVELH